MRSILLAALATMFGLSVACTAPMTDEEIDGDEGDTSADALTSERCNLSRAQILAGATGERREAIERGFGWLDARVPYSQRRFRDGYRTDCSGFISMCWDLNRSYTTPYFLNGTAENDRLGSYNELLPADALVRRSGKSGHIVMFLGWNDVAKRGACVLEQASTKSDMQFRVRTTTQLRSAGYRAVRADRLADE
jgi:hypothetical protein